MSQAGREADEARNLIEPPVEVRDGFGWTTVAGILFCGLVMMPGGIYLGLMTGGGIGGAASWVTLILFMEIARRALKPLSRQHLVVLLHAANVMLTGNLLFPGGPFGQLVFRAYLVTSDAVRDSGMSSAFPSWFAPSPTSRAILERNLLHHDFWQPILVLVFVSIVLVAQRYTLGYFFFRLTSDVERLPFPLAPVSALGATALAEAEPTEEGASKERLKRPGTKPPSERWGAFSLGASIGLAFGALTVAVPALSGLVFAKPLYPLPQPFLDTTTLSESILPATPTGAALDIAVLLLGVVLPVWTVVGTFVALVVTALANPVLHHLGVLHSWRPGMDTVNTVFANNVDFWLSAGIGAGLGVAGASLFGTLKELRALRRQRGTGQRDPSVSVWRPPRPNRGDYPIWVALALYGVISAAVLALCFTLLPRTPGTIFFFLFFVLLYSPFIAYVNARLLGVSGQTVDIPFVRESAIVASGARGVDIWLAPVPVDTSSWQAQSYRVNELTGVSFWSLVKVELVTIPVLFVLSFVFWAFIWRTSPLPSVEFPWASVNWELYAKNQALLYSSTFVPPGEAAGGGALATTEFMRAIHPSFIAGGFVGSLGLFALTSSLGIPLAFYYGVFRGLGQLPHAMVLELAGVLLARFWLWKRFGKARCTRLAPILFAGYLTGVGLIAMGAVALRLIQAAVSSSPF